MFTAINDPIGFLIYFGFGINANIWVIINSLVFLYFFEGYKLKFNLKPIIIIFVITSLAVLGMPTNLIIISIDIIILMYFIIDLIKWIKDFNEINLFVFTLATYQLTIILNNLFSANLNNNSDYYLYTIISMFAFAIFFTFTNEKSKFLQVNINKYLVKEYDD